MRSNCWDAAEHCGTPKRTDGTSQRYPRHNGANAQKKKLSSRQKIDTQILGSKIVNDNN